MKNTQFFLYYFLLTLAQVLVCGFLNISQYAVISILPMLVMCIPAVCDTRVMIVIAFLTGLAVDFLSTGMIGEISIPLMVLALLRNPILVLQYGDEILSRRDGPPLSRQGGVRVSATLFIACALYFLIFVWVDAAGTRTFWFNFVRWLCSTASSSLVSMAVLHLLFTEK